MTQTEMALGGARVRLLTVEEVAERLRISRKTVYRLFASGELRSFRIGNSRRIREVDLEQYIADRLAAR